jgi:hypothetical protein
MSGEQDPGDFGAGVIEWLLDGDPAIRRQVLRDPDNHLFEISQLTLGLPACHF